jgi:peptide/nickel transport system substrate-binding protein
VTMDDSRVDRLFAQARAGRMSRRQLLETGLKLGLASPLILSLIEAAPEPAVAAPVDAPGPAREPAHQSSGKTFVNITSTGVEDIDPHYSYSTLSSTVAMAVYEMLLQLKGDSTTEFEPMLAQSWEANDDKSVYTFKLAPNAKFHDGTVCDAQAVKDSYTRWIELGGSPVNVITRFVPNPDAMVVVDPQTLRFELGKPQPLFLSAMASQYGPSVISPTAIKKNATKDDPYAHEFFKANAVGTGPYVLKSNQLNEGMVFDKFADYHMGWEGDHFDSIVFRVVPEDGTRRQLLESGDGDGAAYNLTIDAIADLKKNPALNVVEYPSTAVSWAILNAKLLNTAARQGFSYAFPYDDVVNSVFKGLMKRNGPIADTVRGWDKNVFLYKTDLDKAKDLIIKGGFKEGDSFQYMCDANDQREQTVAQLFQANVQQMGFQLEIDAVDYTTVESTIFGDQPPEEKPHIIGGWGWWPDYNDPWNQLAPNFNKDQIGNGGSNGGAWVNDRYEELMAQAEHFKDEAQLDTLMKEIQNILTEQDPPAIYYGQPIYYTVLRADIGGFYPNPLYLASYPFYSMYRKS